MLSDQSLTNGLELSTDSSTEHLIRAATVSALRSAAPTIILDQPAKVYHSLSPEFLSFHSLDILTDGSPLECGHWLEHPRPPTELMIEGTAGHSVLLEGNLGECAVKPTGLDSRTKEGKETLRKLREEFGQNLISEEWANALLEIETVYRDHEAVRKLILPNITHTEPSIYWQDKELGLWRKSRPDIYCEQNAILADLKFTNSFKRYDLQRTIRNFGYHRQLAYYREALAAVGMHVEHCLLVFIKRTKPYDVAVVRVSDDAIDAGHTQNRTNLEVFADCLESGVWPGAFPYVTEIGLPSWSSVDPANEGN